MKKKIYSINGKILTAKWFAYDGCHEIYTIENEQEKAEAKSYGYRILHITQIRETYKHSCPLRFIDSWNLEEEYVPQYSCLRKILWGYYPKYKTVIGGAL